MRNELDGLEVAKRMSLGLPLVLHLGNDEQQGGQGQKGGYSMLHGLPPVCLFKPTLGS